jgi:hypothetical protein
LAEEIDDQFELSLLDRQALGIDMTATLLARADDCEFSGQYLFETSI